MLRSDLYFSLRSVLYCSHSNTTFLKSSEMKEKSKISYPFGGIYRGVYLLIFLIYVSLCVSEGVSPTCDKPFVHRLLGVSKGVSKGVSLDEIRMIVLLFELLMEMCFSASSICRNLYTLAVAHLHLSASCLMDTTISFLPRTIPFVSAPPMLAIANMSMIASVSENTLA